MTAIDERDDLEVFFERWSDTDNRNRGLIALGLSIALYVVMTAFGASPAEMRISNLVPFIMAMWVIVSVALSKRAWIREHGRIVETFRAVFIFYVGKRDLDWRVVNESLWLESTNENRKKRKVGTIEAVASDGETIRLDVATPRMFD